MKNFSSWNLFETCLQPSDTNWEFEIGNPQLQYQDYKSHIGTGIQFSLGCYMMPSFLKIHIHLRFV